MPVLLECQQEKVTLSRFLRRTETVEGNGFNSHPRGTAEVCNGDYTGQVFQVTYRVPLELVTRVNGCYNDGATSLTNLICRKVSTVSKIDVGMSPLCASALFLEHDTPVATQGSLNSPIRDNPASP